jgi:5-methyltetrahydropteroyltriglutamate--homocysteine methyltransferase
VVLGVMSSKRAEIEAKDAIKARIEEAARYVDQGQLCLSHQCGFSSTVHGNLLGEDDQWKKLARMVEVAREVWGG